MSLRTCLVAALAASALAATAAATAAAQEPATAMAKTAPPGVGAMAPDFSLHGATRYGVLQKHASLSDYKGKTVVLAFFFRARTRG